MKIESVSIVNLKAVVAGRLDLKGCTAIVTGPNDSGKTTLLKSIPDRIRFVRPEVMVTEGQVAGSGTLTLTNGDRFVWEFDVKGKDKLTYFTKDGLKQSVTKELGRRFFPGTFDIDKFLQSSPKDQSQQLQRIVGLDFTDIDARYDKAYRERTARNADAERYHVKLTAMLKVPAVDAVNLEELQIKKEAIRQEMAVLYRANKAKNEEARAAWQAEVDALRRQWQVEAEEAIVALQEFNKSQRAKETARGHVNRYIALINEANREYKDMIPMVFVDLAPVRTFLETLPEPEPIKTYTPADDPILPKQPLFITEMPDDTELRKVDAEIMAAVETNQKAKAYADYIAYKKQVDDAKALAELANIEVLNIEEERRQLIATAHMPEGIEIAPDGIKVDGLPLSKDQLSTSKLYIAALRIGSINLGKVKTLYFDASYLDNKNLHEVELWAQREGLQLLIERPKLDGGEIAYQLIENL